MRNGRRSASEDYHTFLQQPSGNMDHRAFYSIQVINNALKVQSLELILFSTPECQKLWINPKNERLFICSYKEHWFIVRKLGKQWFNLKFLLTGPELRSHFFHFSWLSYNRKVILYLLLRMICQIVTNSCRWPESNKCINQNLLEKN